MKRNNFSSVSYINSPRFPGSNSNSNTNIHISPHHVRNHHSVQTQRTRYYSPEYPMATLTSRGGWSGRGHVHGHGIIQSPHAQHQVTSFDSSGSKDYIPLCSTPRHNRSLGGVNEGTNAISNCSFTSPYSNPYLQYSGSGNGFKSGRGSPGRGRGFRRQHQVLQYH